MQLNEKTLHGVNLFLGLFLFLFVPVVAKAELLCFSGFEDGVLPTQTARWWEVDDGLYPPDDWNDTSCVKFSNVGCFPQYYVQEIVGTDNGVTPRNGSQMAKLEVRTGAPPVDPGCSTDNDPCCHRLGAKSDNNGADIGKTMWFAFSVYIDTWPTSTEWRLLGNLHTQNCDESDGRCPGGEGTRKSGMAFQTRAGSSDMQAIVVWDDAACSTSYSWHEENIYTSPVSQWIGRWIDVVYEIKLEYNNTGYVNLWINDTKYDPDYDGYTYRGPTYYNDNCGPHLELPAIYQNKDGSLPVRIYVDEIRIAQGDADYGGITYSDMAPRSSSDNVYFVAQSSAGSGDGTSYADRASVAYHNAGSGVFSDLDGKTVVLTGLITDRVTVPDGGTASNRVIYTGKANYGGSGNPAGEIDRSDGNHGMRVDYPYVTVEDISFRNSEEGLKFHNNASYCEVKRCSFDRICQGILISGSGVGYITVGGAPGDGNTFTNSFPVGSKTETACSDINPGGGVDNITASWNTHDNGVDGFTVHSPGGGSSNILVEYNIYRNMWSENCIDYKGAEDSVIRYNYCYGSNSQNIVIHMESKRVDIYGNWLEGSGNSGILIMHNHDGGTGYTEDIDIWGNVIANNAGYGVGVIYSKTSQVRNVSVFNNTITGNAHTPSRSDITGIGFVSGSGHIAKNNILYNNRPNETDHRQVYVGAGNVTLDNNLYYWTNQTSRIYWSGADRDLVTLQGTYGQESDGFEADPKFSDIVNKVYTLNSASPAIDRGLNLGTAFSDILNPGSSGSFGPDWVTSVSLLNQNAYGSGWEVGAYVHTDSTACHKYTSSDPVQAGYGSPYNLGQNNPSELLVGTTCNTNSVNLDVGNGDVNMLVYQQGHIYDGSNWQSVTLSGSNQPYTGWYAGNAGAANIPVANMSTINYIVAYTCYWNGQSWRCGCADSACIDPCPGTTCSGKTGGLWQLQAFSD